VVEASGYCEDSSESAQQQPYFPPPPTRPVAYTTGPLVPQQIFPPPPVHPSQSAPSPTTSPVGQQHAYPPPPVNAVPISPQLPSGQQQPTASWGPLFNQDGSPTNVFVTMMQEFFSFLDPTRTGYLTPEAYSKFLRDQCQPLEANICKWIFIWAPSAGLWTRHFLQLRIPNTWQYRVQGVCEPDCSHFRRRTQIKSRCSPQANLRHIRHRTRSSAKTREPDP
jgi:hypothetical protein